MRLLDMALGVAITLALIYGPDVWRALRETRADRVRGWHGRERREMTVRDERREG